MATNPNQQYLDQLNAIYNQIMNRGAFSYDMANDPFYQQYAQQYTQLGKQAMRDTQAQSASLTGGYGNSWAASAGSQAYQGYLDQLNNMAPEFYDRAYQQWLGEGDMLATQYNLAATHPATVATLTPQFSGGGSGKKTATKLASGATAGLGSIGAGLYGSVLNDAQKQTPTATTSPKAYKDVTGSWPGTNTHARLLNDIEKKKKE